MGDMGQGFEVGNINGRIAQAFDVQRLRVIRNEGFKSRRVVGVGETGRNAEALQRFCK